MQVINLLPAVGAVVDHNAKAVFAALFFGEARRKTEVAAFLRPRAERFEGAPRALAVALEEVDGCIAARARIGDRVVQMMCWADGLEARAALEEIAKDGDHPRAANARSCLDGR